MTRNFLFSELIETWPSAFVARKEVAKFSGGILHHRTMANLDSRGEGPKRRVKMGRTIAYRVEDLVKWMEERAELEEITKEVMA